MNETEIETFVLSILQRLKDAAGQAWVEPTKVNVSMRAKWRKNQGITARWEVEVLFRNLVVRVSKSMGESTERIVSRSN